MEQFESRYFSGQGPIFIGLRDVDGKPAGLTFIGDCSEVSLTPSVEKSQVTENVTGAGGIGSEFVKKVEYSFSLTAKSIKSAHLALILQASNTAQAAGSVTDEAVVGYHDKFMPLANVKLSTVVLTDGTGTTTYTAGTDYVIHADEGMLEILSTGAITDAQALLVDYSFAAQHLHNASPANQDYYLTFSGMNRADNNKQTRCEIYKLKLDPSALGMIQDEHADMPITGTVLLDTLRASGDQFYSWKIED